MNRFHEKFLSQLVEFSKEYGFVITEDGYIEPIQDWVQPRQSFTYTVEEDENGIKITGVEMV
jgi:hypothetical protein